MERSQYLAQALQAMSAAPAQTSSAGMSPAQMQAMAKQAKAWKAKHPGESYLGSRFTQAGRNLAAVPGQLMDAVGMGQQQAAAPQAPQPSGLQASLVANGNATPEFQVPEWARDGTPAGDPGLATYMDASGMPTPWGGQPASTGRNKGAGAIPPNPSTGGAGSLGVLGQLLQRIGSRG